VLESGDDSILANRLYILYRLIVRRSSCFAYYRPERFTYTEQHETVGHVALLISNGFQRTEDGVLWVRWFG